MHLFQIQGQLSAKTTTTHKLIVFVDVASLDSEEGSMHGDLERDVLPFSNDVNSKNNKKKMSIVLLC
jgi:hypothetical protein